MGYRKKEIALSALFTRGVVITGTGTGVGKTLFAMHCLKETLGTYWKPIQAGKPSDREKIQARTQLDDSHFLDEIYALERPLSPHEAALREGRTIDLEAFSCPESLLHPPLIIEGAGGVLVPLNAHALMVDLFCRFGLPVVVVARSELGTINHSLMTLECLRSRGLEVLGVVVVGPSHPENEAAIARYGAVPILETMADE